MAIDVADYQDTKEAEAADQLLREIRELWTAGDISSQLIVTSLRQLKKDGRVVTDPLYSHGFTAQEIKVAELFLKKGMSKQAVSKALFLTENTVKFHTQNIYGKLGIRRKELAAKALLA